MSYPESLPDFDPVSNPYQNPPRRSPAPHVSWQPGGTVSPSGVVSYDSGTVMVGWIPSVKWRGLAYHSGTPDLTDYRP